MGTMKAEVLGHTIEEYDNGNKTSHELMLYVSLDPHQSVRYQTAKGVNVIGPLKHVQTGDTLILDELLKGSNYDYSPTETKTLAELFDTSVEKAPAPNFDKLHTAMIEEELVSEQYELDSIFTNQNRITKKEKSFMAAFTFME